MSRLKTLRNQYTPKLPPILEDVLSTSIVPEGDKATPKHPKIAELFPRTSGLKPLKIISSETPKTGKILKVGVVLSGGQAAGGHNVIAALFDTLRAQNPESQLFGFLGGPVGIVKGNYIEITQQLLVGYRNTGGFDLIGSGRTKIETEEQLQAADEIVTKLDLDGLVIIGGDDSNTNAAILAERFAEKGIKTSVIGVPKTIDGDLKSGDIEISFGFDTACKIYSETIGNLLCDALSAKKYYFFVKLMGRSASHIALECALQTHPNLTLISEEVAAKQMTLQQIAEEIADLICTRQKAGKEYGVILIPEGLIEFIPEMKALIKELNHLLAKNNSNGSNEGEPVTYVKSKLSESALKTYTSLPEEIQTQLILTRDDHGNVQVSKIETERLLIAMTEVLLKKRATEGSYKGSFSPQPMFCGYEGRSAYPSNFDANYCAALGTVAALLINAQVSGYMASIQNLAGPIEKWQPRAIPLPSLMTIEERGGKSKPVIQKALVDLEGKPFAKFAKMRESLKLDDSYIFPGPIQFFGPPELTDAITLTLALEIMTDIKRPCPCHSGKEYAECCKSYHEGRVPENALLLMRSRYAAYALNLAEYLIATTHPQNPKYVKDKAAWKRSIEEMSISFSFHDLKIIDFSEEGESAIVTFIAGLSCGKQDATFTEKSSFEKVEGRWLYKDGMIRRI